MPSSSTLTPQVHRQPLTAQPGGQTAFLSTPADIALFGGHAGASKSFSVLLEPTRHIKNPRFTAVIFRRTYPQIMNEGGLWDDSFKVYPQLGGEPVVGETEWRFPSGATISFRHMQHEKNRTDWDGSQVPLVEFDEVQHFVWLQVSYMFSRMRTDCGVRPYQRWTANPPPNPRRHWLRKFVDWWIGEDGFPILERSGVLRWVTIHKDKPVWGDSPGEVIEKVGNTKIRPKSFTFIPGTLADNPKMVEKDPDYEANLYMLAETDRLRLMGNWNVESGSGTYYRREWWRFVPAVPNPGKVRWIRYWDTAATEWDPENPGERVDPPSKSAGVLLGFDDESKRLYVGDGRSPGLIAGYWTAGDLKLRMRAAAEADGRGVHVGVEVEPGGSGKTLGQDHAANLHGFKVWRNKVRESKDARARTLSPQVQAGNVFIVGNLDMPWVQEFVDDMEAFDGEPGGPNDVGDASSGGYTFFTGSGYVGAPHRKSG